MEGLLISGSDLLGGRTIEDFILMETARSFLFPPKYINVILRLKFGVEFSNAPSVCLTLLPLTSMGVV